MKLLADTHVFVWASIQPELLSPVAADALTDLANAVLLSTISAYEVELKRERDPALMRMPANLDHAMTALSWSWLPLAPG